MIDPFHRLLRRLFQQSGIPLTPKTFWRYSAWFWGGFAVISYMHYTIWELLTQGSMYYTETWHWLVKWVLWWALSPFILWAANRYPISTEQGWLVLVRRIGMHLLILSLLSLSMTCLEYGAVRRFYELETSKAMPPNQIIIWFFSRYSLVIAIYMLVVVGYQIIVASYRYQALQKQALQTEMNVEQLQAQLDQAQLQALKMQLNPHFLFNTHHTIIGLIVQHENKKAIAMLTALSSLLRSIVDHTDVQFVTLTEEMDFIRSYLRIQQIRFQDRLDVAIDLTPETLDCTVPQYILQPLVENAFVHGLEKIASQAKLVISASRENDQLIMKVQDNGPGIRGEISRAGVGIRNTQRRLAQLYGEMARLNYGQTLGGGTTFTVTIPLN
ncbi:sensor histidine kinase [Larkinella sp. GY13]|uniref:sensor histidine kinase n=1 Tax=Larkinella sp. GY13 TaxID=3453720 RepID=UPI003EECB4D1